MALMYLTRVSSSLGVLCSIGFLRKKFARLGGTCKEGSGHMCGLIQTYHYHLLEIGTGLPVLSWLLAHVWGQAVAQHWSRHLESGNGYCVCRVEHC